MIGVVVGMVGDEAEMVVGSDGAAENTGTEAGTGVETIAGTKVGCV